MEARIKQSMVAGFFLTLVGCADSCAGVRQGDGGQRSDSVDGSARCSATCDDESPCLAGFTCVPVAGCDGAGCGACFPE